MGALWRRAVRAAESFLLRVGNADDKPFVFDHEPPSLEYNTISSPQLRKRRSATLHSESSLTMTMNQHNSNIVITSRQAWECPWTAVRITWSYRDMRNTVNFAVAEVHREQAGGRLDWVRMQVVRGNDFWNICHLRLQGDTRNVARHRNCGDADEK